MLSSMIDSAIIFVCWFLYLLEHTTSQHGLSTIGTCCTSLWIWWLMSLNLEL